MLKSDSSLMMLIVAAVVALAVGYYVPRTFSQRPAIEVAATDTAAKPANPGAVPSSTRPAAWSASAPGRVEPAGGEVRLGALAAGRVASVLVAVGDKVQAGDLIARLDDEDHLGRILALSADLNARKRERDNGDVSAGNLARERRTAEDNLAVAERQLYGAREELDRALQVRSAHVAGETLPDLDKVREAVTKARERVDLTRANLRRALAVDGLPAPTRMEVAVAAARAELSAAEAALERTRIRASITATLLAVSVRIGEVLVPSPELPVAVLGNLSQLRVRSEFEERDLGKVRDGQQVTVRADAFPGRDFEGKISLISPSLTLSRIGQRGPRKLNDVDVLEVLVSLTGETPLMPGMRVDVFLRPESVSSAAPKAN